MRTINKYHSGLFAYCKGCKKITEVKLEFDCISHYWGELTGGDHTGKVVVFCIKDGYRVGEITEDDEYNANID